MKLSTDFNLEESNAKATPMEFGLKIEQKVLKIEHCNSRKLRLTFIRGQQTLEAYYVDSASDIVDFKSQTIR